MRNPDFLEIETAPIRVPRKSSDVFRLDTEETIPLRVVSTLNALCPIPDCINPIEFQAAINQRSQLLSILMNAESQDDDLFLDEEVVAPAGIEPAFAP
jgi:hypothetical protein